MTMLTVSQRRWQWRDLPIRDHYHYDQHHPRAMRSMTINKWVAKQKNAATTKAEVASVAGSFAFASTAGTGTGDALVLSLVSVDVVGGLLPLTLNDRVFVGVLIGSATRAQHGKYSKPPRRTKRSTDNNYNLAREAVAGDAEAAGKRTRGSDGCNYCSDQKK